MNLQSASSAVAMRRCQNYNRSEIALLIDEMAATLALGISLRGSVVLLKPNLISSRAPALACTHGEFIAGVALWFLEQGARVRLGDSPAFGSTTGVCNKHGITDALYGLDVEYREFRTPVKRNLSRGISVDIAAEALECDLFVGLPRVKAHNQLFVTLAVKNLFGMVKGTNKAMLHMKEGRDHGHFSRIILDLVELLPPQMHFADGITAMHRSGPVDGEPLPLHLLAGALSPVALDTAILEALELDVTKSPLWAVAAREGDVCSDPARLHYPLNTPSHFHGSGFIAPASLNPIRFNPLIFLAGMIKKILSRNSG